MRDLELMRGMNIVYSQLENAQDILVDNEFVLTTFNRFGFIFENIQNAIEPKIHEDLHDKNDVDL